MKLFSAKTLLNTLLYRHAHEEVHWVHDYKSKSDKDLCVKS